MKLHIWITQSNLTQGSYSFERFKFCGFFHDLFKFSIIIGLAVTFKNFQNFPCFRVFFDLKQFNRHKLWCPPKCMRFKHCLITPLYITVSYIVLALSSAVTDVLNKTLICHDFRWPKTKFHDFSGLENEILKFHDFPGFPRPVWILLLCDHPLPDGESWWSLIGGDCFWELNHWGFLLRRGPDSSTLWDIINLS